jgi:hypothetical protein
MTLDGDGRDRLAELRGVITAGGDRPRGTVGLLERVCHAAVGTLSASGAGASVITEDGMRGVCAASDRVSEHVEELQFVLGEGPCVDAFATRRPVLSPDLAAYPMSRWPAYAPAARESGIQAVFAFPLQVGGARLGVMDVFRTRTGPLTADELATALLLADLTVEVVLDHHRHDGVSPDGLAMDVGNRAQLFQAQGMVMVQLGVSLAEALVRMRAHAYAEDRRLDDVACDIVERTLRFSRDQP